MKQKSVNVLGVALIVLVTLLIIMAFVPPYWLEYTGTGRAYREGLWLRCADQGRCVWSFGSQKGYEDSLQDWFKATQGLMSIGLACALIALIFGTVSLCCRCKNCNTGGIIAGFLVTCFLAIGTAVTLFGIKAYKDLNATVSWDNSLSTYRFGWSYWLAVASAGSALFSSVIYACSGQCNSS